MHRTGIVQGRRDLSGDDSVPRGVHGQGELRGPDPLWKRALHRHVRRQAVVRERHLVRGVLRVRRGVYRPGVVRSPGDLSRRAVPSGIWLHVAAEQLLGLLTFVFGESRPGESCADVM